MGQAKAAVQCTRKGIAVDKDSVRLVLKELDPERVAQWSRHKLGRRKYYAKGPSSIWHLDGNDKGNRMDQYTWMYW